jgi:hypothetical protein
MGFEPTRAEHIGLAVQRLNHSATSSSVDGWWSYQLDSTALTNQMSKRFPRRESNPGLLGESQIS